MLCIFLELFLERLTLWWKSLRTSDLKAKTSNIGASSCATCFCRKTRRRIEREVRRHHLFPWQTTHTHSKWELLLWMKKTNKCWSPPSVWGLREGAKRNRGIEVQRSKLGTEDLPPNLRPHLCWVDTSQGKHVRGEGWFSLSYSTAILLDYWPTFS